MKNKNFIIRIDDEQLKKFDNVCKQNNKTKSEVIRMLIDKYINWKK